MRRTLAHLALGLGLAVAAVAPALRAGGSEFVVVSATAAPDYKRVTGPDGFVPETYVFSPGIHFGGNTRDQTQEQMPFLAIAKMLAPNLARQAYFPIKDAAQANLVIIVHWGSTDIFEDPDRQANLEALGTELAAYNAAIQQGGMATAGAINGLLSNQEGVASRQEQFLNESAMILGYKRSLRKEEAHMFSSPEEITMRAELSEERYFVVLMAYDYAALKKKKERRLLWVTRMSVRAPGNNFAESIPGMARIAADFFGQQHDDLSRVQTKLREGKVDIGELKVVDPVVTETVKPAAPKK